MHDATKDVVVDIYECWDWEDGGRDLVRKHVVQKVEQAKLDGINLQLLADEMSNSITSGEGWTIADARLLKDVFSQYGVVFKAEI